MPRIDVFADLVCPWCYIGKRQLDQARALLGGVGHEPELRWRAYELRPDMPAGGVPMDQFLHQAFPSGAARERAHAMVAAMGETVGIAFRFHLQTRAPNTRLAHRAIAAVRLLADRVAADRVVDELFASHFELGEDIGSLAGLRLALERAELPIDIELVLDELALGGGLRDVEADAALAAQLGVRSVPLFIDGDLRAVAGAQPPEQLAEFLASSRASDGVLT